jgi:divalent metal cation (Fe/Co/Zn/Cd) transporter
MESEIKERLYTRVRTLEYFTIVWNVIEGFVAVSVGVVSGSLSLVAFGLESGIEVFSSAVVIWELRSGKEKVRKYGLRMIGIALVLMAISIAVHAAMSLLAGRRAEPSLVGILFMFAVTAVMLAVGFAKRRLGKRLDDQVVVAESGVTLLDAGLSASIMTGLLLNLAFGWWWTDQILALLLAGNALREGVGGIWKGFSRS